MPARPLSFEQAREAFEAFQACHKNKAAAARSLGLQHATYCNRLAAYERYARRKTFPTPEAPPHVIPPLQPPLHGRPRRETPSLQEPPPQNSHPAEIQSLHRELKETRAHFKAALAAATRPRFVIRQDAIPRSEKLKILVIGDAHDSPALGKTRFEWMGAHVNASKPDVVVQIGDFANWDSLSRHVANSSLRGRAKTTFQDDLASFSTALDAFGSRLNHACAMHCTLGNHERRLYRFEDRAPEVSGVMQGALHAAFDRHGWMVSPYGEITFFGGVGFVHAALNRLGKIYGGKRAEADIADDAIHDLVIGHSHVERIQRAPKIGRGNYVQILNVGCALPDGHIEDYAAHALTGWAWGVMEITLQHGHIQDRTWIGMARLKELYG